MTSVDDLITEIIAREGGFVNDPDDPGGATNFGVTIHTMRSLGLDLDGDGLVGVSDVRALTRDQAIDIFECGDAVVERYILDLVIRRNECAGAHSLSGVEFSVALQECNSWFTCLGQAAHGR